MDTITLPVPADASFVASQDFENILREIKDTTDATRMFEIIWAFPFQTVRQACLEEFQNPPPFKPMYPPSENIAEKVIRGMMTSGGVDDRKLAEALLIWHLNYCTLGDDNHPIDFALTLLREIQSILPEHYSKVHGIVYGTIRRKKSWYWASSVPEFLEASLASDNWTFVERALELICLAEDTSFLPRVMELGRKAREEAEKKEDFKTRNADQRFASAKALGVLQESVRHLLLCKVEQDENHEGFQVKIAEELKRIGAFKLPPRVEFQHEVWAAESLLWFGISVMCNDSPEQKFRMKFAGLLEHCRVNVKVDGIRLSSNGFSDRAGPHNPPQSQSIDFIYNPKMSWWFTASFLLEPLKRQTCRVKVSFLCRDGEKGAWREVAKITRYITRAD